jgi:hypothetical protein
VCRAEIQKKDVAYAHWKCVGNSKVCQGEFTFTAGTGGFNGMSGTTSLQTSIIFEQQEGKSAQAIGCAVWPSLTYTLPYDLQSSRHAPIFRQRAVGSADPLIPSVK